MFTSPIADKTNIINNGKNIDGYTGIFPLFPKELKIKFI